MGHQAKETKNGSIRLECKTVKTQGQGRKEFHSSRGSDRKSTKEAAIAALGERWVKTM